VADLQWRRCSACKKPIPFGAVYWVCNVSTCNQKRTGLAFCTVSCWEVHLPTVRHRESWAVEKRAPASAAAAGGSAAGGTAAGSTAAPAERAPERRRIIPSAPASKPEPRPGAARVPHEVLIIASRLRDYVKARSGCNTSDRALEPLSDLVRRAADEAIRNAERDGRKTVLERDVPRS
jgi:hypothetical protein